MKSDQQTRRRTLRMAGIAVVGSLTTIAGCSADGSPSRASGDDSSLPTFDGYLSNVSNYDGVADRTGTDAVTVDVGAQGNGGALAFAPAAVRIATGTTVTWEWTGKGGSHNVVHEGDAFASNLVAEAGHTFKHTFDTAGEFKYFCSPHKAAGMKGVIVVE